MSRFLPEKYFSLRTEWDYEGLKYTKFKEGLESSREPGSARESINNLWPVGTEDLYSDHSKIIFSL